MSDCLTSLIQWWTIWNPSGSPKRARVTDKAQGSRLFQEGTLLCGWLLRRGWPSSGLCVVTCYTCVCLQCTYVLVCMVCLHQGWWGCRGKQRPQAPQVPGLRSNGGWGQGMWWVGCGWKTGKCRPERAGVQDQVLPWATSLHTLYFRDPKISFRS